MRFTLICLIFVLSTVVFAEDVNLNPLDTATKLEETLISSKDITFYPESIVDRPLVLPEKLVEVRAHSEYRQLSKNIRSLDIRGATRIGVIENMELIIETSVFPLNFLEDLETPSNIFSSKGFSFGGVALGSAYNIINETENIPAVAAALNLGFAGTGPISLTYGSTFIVLPEVKVKKVLSPQLALDGNLTLGFGNTGSGIYQLMGGGIFRPFEQIDVLTHASLEAVGFDQIATLSIIPGVSYHISDKMDIEGSFRIGVVGGEAIGNNFAVGIASRF
jgi:hypothetical protein